MSHGVPRCLLMLSHGDLCLLESHGVSWCLMMSHGVSRCLIVLFLNGVVIYHMESHGVS